MSRKKAHKSEIDRLREFIRQSGFPLEIELSSVLDSARDHKKLKDMDVSMGAYYLDKDTKQGRELDSKVSIPIRYKGELKGKKRNLIGMFLDLLIQCKKIPGNAWVFFKTPQEIVSVPQCTSVLDCLEWVPRSHSSFAFLPDLHYGNVLKTTIYDEYILDENRTNKKVDNLFEAIVTLTKATAYELDTTIQGLRDTIDRFKDISYYPVGYVKLFYPVVVFDGKMYIAEKTKEYGEMDLTPIDHVCLFFDYISGSYDIDLHIDIVQREAFDEFFQSVVRDIEILEKALENKTGIKFREEVKNALNLYRGK